MMPTERLAREVFARLEKLDEKIAAGVAAGRCRHCEGPLHQGNYQRKPRGGLIATEGEAFTRRHSLCCGRRGCRKRSLPPSLRFLGRRVYLEVVVVLASVMAQIVAAAREAVAASGVPMRTLHRWGCWWREVFPKLRMWAELRARFVPPPPAEDQLPRSLIVRLGGGDQREDDGGEVLADEEVLLALARYLAPATTDSVVEGSRFVTTAMAQMGAQ
jgi:hypothetical protein